MSPHPRPGQLLSPEKRLAHQPRLGVPLSSAAVLEMTGCGGGSRFQRRIERVSDPAPEGQNHMN